VGAPETAWLRFNNRTLRDSNGLRYTRQPRCIIRVKYHILVDTLGRDGAALVLDKHTRAMFPFITKLFADGGY
jgi:hypothetical protein